MLVTDLTLHYFRNLNKKRLTFSPQTTVIVGPNGAGKTNILESLYFLATGKSFRADQDREMIQFGQELCRVTAPVINNSRDDALEIILTRGEVMGIKTAIKKYSVNGVGKRMVDFVGMLKVVLFWPEDLELITSSPSLRRRYLDYVLIQVDREYRRTLQSYERGLRQRNKILEAIKLHGGHRHQLIFWDQLLIKSGEYLTRKREEYVTFLNAFTMPDQGGNKTIFRIQYDKSIISEGRLEQYQEQEVAAETTLVGPHRDDIVFEIGDHTTDGISWRNIAHFGSRGEQRLAILWIKLGELSYIESVTGDKPILLLDDIFSELDRPHRQYIFDVIHAQQTILTATDVDPLARNELADYRLISLPE